jgi:hypothetical protein
MGRHPLPRALVGCALLVVGSTAFAQSSVPKREIPPTVLGELSEIQNQFEHALAADCSAQRCFSKGCVYVDHAVADRPRARSLPGFSMDPGPGSVETQAFLTRARCGFTYEPSVTADDAQALSRRLQSKVSMGWTSVSVSAKELQPLPAYMGFAPGEEPVEEEEPELVIEPEEPEWTAGIAVRELWVSLLPHAWWMIGLVMATVAGTLLIWAWRRVGRESLEERMMLAEMERGLPEEPTEPEGTEPETLEELPENEQAFVAEQSEAWTARLSEFDPASPDPELHALVRELLRSGDRALLGKAVVTFPALLTAFPAGGDIASAKLELADYLKTIDPSTLPNDAEFYRSLNRHALSASLASQSDARVVRSLREDFGAAGLVTLIRSLPARAGSLLFALAPTDEQFEMVRLLSANQIANMADQMLRSNRMDVSETDYLFEVLRASGSGMLPEAPAADEVSDRGATFDAAGALSVLLPGLSKSQRSNLFGRALQRFHGSLPAWYQGILTADMLFELPDEARNDLLLEVDADSVAAWMSMLDGETRERLVSRMPNALRASVESALFPDRSRQLALAEQGRRWLAEGFQAQLERARIPFERVVRPEAPAASPPSVDDDLA